MADRCYPLDRDWGELWDHYIPDAPPPVMSATVVPLVKLPQISDEDWERMAWPGWLGPEG